MSESPRDFRRRTESKNTQSQKLADQAKARVRAEARAVDENTARLKALRLAKEAKDAKDAADKKAAETK